MPSRSRRRPRRHGGSAACAAPSRSNPKRSYNVIAGSFHGKTCSSSFRTPLPRPVDGRFEKCASDPCRRASFATISPRSATCALAGCVSRASESRPMSAPSLALRDEDGSVRVAPQRLQIPPLVADAAPLAVGRDQPRLRLAAHRLREPRQLLGVRRIGLAHDERDAQRRRPPRRGGGRRRRPSCRRGAPRPRSRRRRTGSAPSSGRRPPAARARRRRRRFAVDDAASAMNARRLDRLLDGHPRCDDVRRHLQDRAAQARAAGAAEHEPRPVARRARSTATSSTSGARPASTRRRGRARRACCSGGRPCPGRRRRSRSRATRSATPRCRRRRGRRCASFPSTGAASPV